MEENKYAPLTEAEFEELKAFIETIGAYLPDNMANYTWQKFNQLRGQNETQPCTCPSSGKHWARAIDYLRGWINERK